MQIQAKIYLKKNVKKSIITENNILLLHILFILNILLTKTIFSLFSLFLSVSICPMIR